MECEKDYVFIWNMFSLNDIRPSFNVNTIIKQCELGLKQTISDHLRCDVTIWISTLKVKL